MKRRIGRAAILLATATILFFYPFLAPPPHRIDQAHFDMIKSGMTEAQVESIFGVPAGEYDWAVNQPMHVWADVSYFTVKSWRASGTTPQQLVSFDIRPVDIDCPAIFPGSWLTEVKSWTGRHGAFHVVFDRRGRVSSGGWVGETRIEPPWQHWWRQLRGK